MNVPEGLTAGKGVTGTFAAVVVNNLDPSLVLTVSYNPNDVTLTVASAPAAGQGDHGVDQVPAPTGSPAPLDAYFTALGQPRDHAADDLGLAVL